MLGCHCTHLVRVYIWRGRELLGRGLPGAEDLLQLRRVLLLWWRLHGLGVHGLMLHGLGVGIHLALVGHHPLGRLLHRAHAVCGVVRLLLGHARAYHLVLDVPRTHRLLGSRLHGHRVVLSLLHGRGMNVGRVTPRHWLGHHHVWVHARLTLSLQLIPVERHDSRAEVRMCSNVVDSVMFFSWIGAAEGHK